MNLLLAHGCTRTRELAVRAAIGASRGRLVAQLTAESLLLALLGAAAGLMVAAWGVQGLVRLAPATLPHREAIAVDGTVALFAVATSLACSLLFGVVPAWQTTRTDVVDMMKADPTASPRSGATRGLLVAAQLGLSLMLLVGAGLMARAFINLQSVPLGFQPSHVMTMNVQLQVQAFNTGDLETARLKRLAFYHQLADSVRAIPGVDQAGVGLFVPMSGGPIPIRYTLGPGGAESTASSVIALSGFLETLKVPLVAGRYFTADDDSRHVVIVDRQFADRVWPHESALGRRLTLLQTGGASAWAEVVGVVEHVQLDTPRSAPQPELFVTPALRQYVALNIVFRAANALALVPEVQDAVQRLGPGRPVRDIRALADYVADASADTRFALFVLGAFAVLAAILSAVGVYGSVAYATARRTREIAVRLALGADPRRIVSLVLRAGCVWTAVGLATGVVGALVLSRSLSSLLFDVGARDPLTFTAVALLLAAVAIVASVLPAIRAVRVDPMLALRSE
jgi:predicted permease